MHEFEILKQIVRGLYSDWRGKQGFPYGPRQTLSGYFTRAEPTDSMGRLK